jgi:hypothetical protein
MQFHIPLSDAEQVEVLDAGTAFRKPDEKETEDLDECLHDF